MLVDVVNGVGDGLQVHEGNQVLFVHLGDDGTVGCIHDGEVLWIESELFNMVHFKNNIL